MMVLGALILICLAMSTPETIRAGRERLKPWTRAAWIFNAAALSFIIGAEVWAKVTLGHW